MIESPQNEKLKLVRRLRDRKHREREGLCVTEGVDLLDAGRAAGAQLRFVLVAAGAGLDGEEVERELLDRVSELGSGTRAVAVWERPAGAPPSGPCVYLHGVGDPGNVGAIVRSADALLGAAVALGPECADAYSHTAVRASMGSVVVRPPAPAALDSTPQPRVALVAHGGEGVDALAGAATVCLGSERKGLPPGVVETCSAQVTIPLRSGGTESLNVAAAAAIACDRMREAQS
jgi:TrmH family RNA methyltransferase